MTIQEQLTEVISKHSQVCVAVPKQEYDELLEKEALLESITKLADELQKQVDRSNRKILQLKKEGSRKQKRIEHLEKENRVLKENSRIKG